MKNAAHTPGNWTLNGDQLISIHTDEDGDHETLIADIFQSDPDWFGANARLLRAAPELLAALEEIQTFFREYPANTLKGQQRIEQIIGSAIATATG